MEAIASLSHISLGTAEAPLINALEDENEEVRRNAAVALGEIGDYKAVPALIKMLDNSDMLTRTYIIKILRMIDPKFSDSC